MYAGPKQMLACSILVFAVVGHCFAAGPAENSTNANKAPAVVVPFYTGTFTSAIEGGLGGGGVEGEMAGGDRDGLTFSLTYDGVITGLHVTRSECINCQGTLYTGQIDSGSITFSGYDISGQNPPYYFTGTVLAGGTYSAHHFCGYGECFTDYTAFFSFQGAQQPNGWYSTGSLNITGSCGDGCGGGATLTLQTYAPGSGTPVSSLLVPNLHVELAAGGSAMLGDVPQVVDLMPRYDAIRNILR